MFNAELSTRGEAVVGTGNFQEVDAEVHSA